MMILHSGIFLGGPQGYIVVVPRIKPIWPYARQALYLLSFLSSVFNFGDVNKIIVYKYVFNLGEHIFPIFTGVSESY